MKKFTLYCVLLTFLLITQSLNAQNQNARFKMAGPKSETIEVNESFSFSTEIFPFKKNGTKIYGMAVTADIQLENEEGLVRLLLVDNNFEEYLIYEGYSLLDNGLSWSIEELCEETSVLEGIRAHSVKIEIENASLKLNSLVISTQLDPTVKINQVKKEKRQAQNEEKINKINRNLRAKGKNWVAGLTSVAELTYAEKKLLYGQSTFPPGFEYYAGGVISTSTSDSDGPSLKSATASPYVNEWDWRNRHGQNWITPVVNQGLCGSCWAFAATGATEAMVNLYFNQQLHLDLSEQDLLSCSGAGSCSGGYPSTALNYISNTGIVDEGAFPYSETDENCQNKSRNPEELIKIAGRVDFGSSLYPRSEDNLKKMLIEMGPVSGGLYDWAHAMTLVGYKVVEEGDKFYYRDLDLKRYWITVEAGDPLIGKTVWIFKNSWGDRIGDRGYVYVETSITNMGWTHGLKTPFTSSVNNYEVICEDKDGDGYYWWGLGEKPETCNCPDEPDGDDSDPTLGPLDEYGNCLKLTPTFELVNVPASKNLGQNPELPTCDSEVTTINGCSEASVSCEPGEILVNGCERRQTFTYTATDECGNTVSAGTTYTWTEDLTPPVLANVPSDQNLGHNPEPPTCNKEVTAFDECSEVTLTCTPGDIIINGDERSQTFTYLATDECGNIASAATTYTWTERIAVPEADFTAAVTALEEGETAQFEDLSKNSPESWSWKFEGGTPSTSTMKTPSVRYDKPGNYGVTLTVANAGGSDTKTVENFITVEEKLPEYCSSNGNASEEWIASVTVGNQSHPSNSTGTTGYQDLSESVSFNADAGTNVNFSLTPGFLNRWQNQYWRIWMDFNGDYDFDDPGELVYTSARARGTVSGSISIPADVSGTIRMRISMKRDAVPSACETFSNGEVKDYTLQIEEALPQPPVAGFSASRTQVEPGESIQFTDLSSNEPTSWLWEFPGGTPDRSSDPNPLIAYHSSGEFYVSLVVTKEGFEPSEIVKTKYITVTENTSQDYCTPVAVNSSSDYIQNITIGNVLNSSTAGSGYSLSANTVSLAPGQNYSVSLSPNDPKNRNFWRIWVDLNGDGDFDDADETLLAMNNKKGTVTSGITIPANATGNTRMRVAMRNNTAPSACDGYFDGEVKDFPVLFDVAPQASFLTTGSKSLTGDFFGPELYPNPVSNDLILKLETVFSGDSYTVYQANGSKVKTGRIIAKVTTIDLSGNAPGVYLVVIENNKHIFREKVIKK